MDALRVLRDRVYNFNGGGTQDRECSLHDLLHNMRTNGLLPNKEDRSPVERGDTYRGEIVGMEVRRAGQTGQMVHATIPVEAGHDVRHYWSTYNLLTYRSGRGGGIGRRR